jgi:isopentenyl phosphate kinase
MYIIKLGGSVITDKTKECSFRKDVMDNLAKSIKKAEQEAIIIHGAGSFGHILAKKYKLNKGYIERDQLHGFSKTHETVQRLNSMVLQSLQDNGIPAVSISPHSIVRLNDHKLLSMNYDVFKDYLKNKFIPVTFGDVVLDKKLSFSICSGDLLSLALVNHFKPKKMIFVIDEDGLYSSNPKIDKYAKLIKFGTRVDLEELTTSEDSHADVTGGMGGKIETIKNISKKGVDVVLLNGNKPDRLYKVLVGEDAKSTVIHGGKK